MKRWLHLMQLKAVQTIAKAVGLTDPRLYRFFGGGETYAGEVVTVESAMRVETVWACVRLISTTASTLPLQVFRRLPDGRGVMERDVPLYGLLHDRPNADMSAVTFWTAMFASLLLWGNAYAAIDRRADGSVISMTPLLPGRLNVTREADGSLKYHYAWMNVAEDYTEDQIFHVKGFSLDGIVGMSPVSQARETLGIAMAAEKSAGSFFRNGMRPSLVMKAPTYLQESQRERYGDTFMEKFTGSINAGRIPLLEGGWALEHITMTPEDAQLLATRSFSVEQICRWFGVSPAMVGHTEKVTAWGTGLEQMNLWFLTYTLRPWLRAIEQEIVRSIMTPTQRMLYYAEFNVDALLRADSEKRANMMRALVDGGINTPNEMRAKNNDPPLEGGDQLTMAAGRMPLTTLGQVPPTPAPPTDPPRQQGQATPPSGNKIAT
jgi:HK97 family phage portal protein